MIGLRIGEHLDPWQLFPGEELELFKNNLKTAFSQIKTFIPDATRKTSTELYLIAKGYKNGRSA